MVLKMRVSIGQRSRSRCPQSGVIPSGTGVPSLPTDNVAVTARPLQAVLATSSVGVSGVSGTIGPPRIVEAVVGAGRAWRTTALNEFGGVAGESQDTADRGYGNEEGRDGYHVG